MRKHLILMAAVGVPLLGACANESSPPPTPSLTVGFADEGTANRLGSPAIDIVAANPQPLVTAELVGPGGNVVAAASGQTEQPVVAYPAYGPSVGFGIFGSSWSGGRGGGSGTSTGIGVGVPIGGGYGAPETPPGGLFRSRALILLPDMAAYRRDWETSKVRVKFGSATGDSSIAEIPAPAPGGR